jgi:hypothetical protein
VTHPLPDHERCRSPTGAGLGERRAIYRKIFTPAVYYWDDDATTAGFGTAGASIGTWAAPTAGPTADWSLSATGPNAFASFTTGIGDTLNFGNGTTGLAAGTITVSGTVNAGNITFASGSGAIVLSGDTINLAPASTITVTD